MQQLTAREVTLQSSRGDRLSASIRNCRPDEIDAICALQQDVMNTLFDSSLLAPTDRQQFEESLSEDICTAVYRGELMIAYSQMIINRITPRHTALTLGYSMESLRDCVTFDTVFVRPDYRGYGLQRLLWLPLLPLAESLGASYAHTTISPGNLHSLQNAEAMGFSAVMRQTLYGGYDRYILECPLKPK